jgi:uncharacterized protein
VSELEQLLVVQEHDIAIDRLRHRRDTLPERARLGDVEDKLVDLQMRMTEVEERLGVVVRRQTQLEDEIASLDAKITDLDKKLYSGTASSPRELQAMQADIDSLKRHRSELEDKVLETMEEREPLDAEVARLLADRAGLDEQAMVLRAEIAEAESDIVAELETVEDLRAEAAAKIPPQLSALYEQLRAKLGGVGAARLEPGGRCGGCHLTLPATEVARIKRGPADAVVQCDQCGRILVRSE